VTSCDKAENWSVSAVIPAFNAGASIARAIDSVLAQSVPLDEIIVVDDGSTDDTHTVVADYGAAVRYLGQKNLGPSAARNAGIRAAQSAWIAFLDADDEWLPNKLKRQLEVLKAHPDLRWCGANCFNLNSGRQSYRSSPDKARQGLGGKLYFDNYLEAVGNGHIIEATVTLVIRRDVFDEVGLFNERFLRAEDSDEWCRIAFRHPQFGYIADPLANVHLDVRNPVLQHRRTSAKQGKVFREMVASHLPAAKSCGMEAEYRKFARWILKKSLLQTIFHGYKDDARETVDRFGYLFPKVYTAGTYALTVFPGPVSRTAKLLAYLYYLAKLEGRITRRWSDANTAR
jgi:glycosyltransferase involved in cell wall biosynthesis